MMNFSKRMQMLLCSAFTFSLSMWAGDGLTMIVGTYTDTGSTGLYSFMFNQQTGEATLLDSLSMTNPSYLTFAHRPHLLYVVSETNDNHAAVCTVGLNETTGQMRLLNRQLTGGEDPCFVETNGRMVLTANYSGGTMSVFPVLRNGLIGARCYRFAGHAAPMLLPRKTKPTCIPHALRRMATSMLPISAPTSCYVSSQSHPHRLSL
jgi:putative 6-phosphogluconolactonase